MNASAHFNILVAEPDLPAREALSEVLSGLGASVHAAATGRRALDIARSVPIDAGIIDAAFADMTGLQLLAALRLVVRFPVMFVGGVTASKEARMAAADAGAWSWLPRPFEIEVARVTMRLFASLLRADEGSSESGVRRL
ncbi:MAG: putative multi-sensor signal transduction histidine [Planctomycetota bacterium]|nr:MAG: putative multi-sensor signal transduction histidine [Planctomycetota bacterium]